MHAEHAPLGQPALGFLLEKFLDPFGVNEFQVFNLAHAVFRPVALVEMAQAVARKFRAGAAESSCTFAASTQGTFDACFGSILFGKIAPVAGIAFSQVGLADGAIDPAGGDEFWIEFCLRHMHRATQRMSHRQNFQAVTQRTKAGDGWRQIAGTQDPVMEGVQPETGRGFFIGAEPAAWFDRRSVGRSSALPDVCSWTIPAAPELLTCQAHLLSSLFPIHFRSCRTPPSTHR